MRVYDDKGNKITYTVKELGFKTTLGAHSYGGYTWTIKKENAISYKGSYYEGVSNAVFSNCENAYSRYYYGKSSEAKSNANGKSLTLDESKTVTFNFQNTVSETDLTVKRPHTTVKCLEFGLRYRTKTANIMVILLQILPEQLTITTDTVTSSQAV